MEISEDELDLLRSVFDWARTGSDELLAEFLTRGGPVNLTNARGDTLLILATYHSRLPTVLLLLEHDADVDRFNDNGQTALAAAVFRQRGDLVEILLAAGSDPDAGPRSASMIADFFDLGEMGRLLTQGSPGTDRIRPGARRTAIDRAATARGQVSSA